MSQPTVATASASVYRKWPSIALSNGLVEAQIVPQAGGRVMQMTLGPFEYFYVNSRLAGKAPTADGLGPKGAWLNYGGEKLWPAPQGWDGPEQWPGPPDAVLDGSPHEAAIVDAQGAKASVRLVSGKDPRCGIQFARTIEMIPGRAGLTVRATMTNIDSKPRKWGIWSVLQHDASARGGQGHEADLWVYCPMNPRSIHAEGYRVMFGQVNNLAFQPDKASRMMRIHYQRRVGKVGLDCSGGWVATVNGSAGYVFVQRFPFFPSSPYPDNASVEVWLHGPGEYIAAGKLENMPDDPKACPYYIETQLLGPLASLKPGESYSFRYDWLAARIGGSYPVLDCNDSGVVCEKLSAVRKAGKLELSGRFGVFHTGLAGLVFFNSADEAVGRLLDLWHVSPHEPLVLTSDSQVPRIPEGACSLSLVVPDAAGRPTAGLAKAAIG